MGTSLRLSYSASGEDVKKIMLDSRGFSEDPEVAQSDIIVEYFDDQYEEAKAAVKCLMGVFKKIKESIPRDCPRNAFPTSTFVCFS